jgi:hypothetical protein
MNKVQMNYMQSKAALKAVEAVLAERELVFLKGKGRTEKHIWTIEDEAVFDLLSVEFAATVETLDADYTTARLALKAAESALIEYALSISPAGIRETLRRGSKNQIAIREQLIDIVMRLDTSTVPV